MLNTYIISKYIFININCRGYFSDIRRYTCNLSKQDFPNMSWMRVTTRSLSRSQGKSQEGSKLSKENTGNGVKLGTRAMVLHREAYTNCLCHAITPKIIYLSLYGHNRLLFQTVLIKKGKIRVNLQSNKRKGES